MNWKGLRKRTLPIGIDMGFAMAKLVQLSDFGGRLELLSSASVEVPEDRRKDLRQRLDFLAVRLREVLKGAGFKGRRCILALPAGVTFIQHIKLAQTSPDQMDAAVRQELEGKLPFPPAEAVIRHFVVGQVHLDGQTHQEVIVLAVSRRVVDAHLEMAGRCRLEVTGLNVEPCAILECFGRLFRRTEDCRQVTLFLDVGVADTQVVIAHGGNMVFARNLAMGGESIDHAAGEVMDRPVAEIRALRRGMLATDGPSPEAEELYRAIDGSLDTMALEISKCLHYHESVFPSRPVERAIFLGGQALDRRLCQAVARRLNLPSQIGDPMYQISSSGQTRASAFDCRQAQPAWAVAIGLSIGAEIAQVA